MSAAPRAAVVSVLLATALWSVAEESSPGAIAFGRAGLEHLLQAMASAAAAEPTPRAATGASESSGTPSPGWRPENLGIANAAGLAESNPANPVDPTVHPETGPVAAATATPSPAQGPGAAGATDAPEHEVALAVDEASSGLSVEATGRLQALLARHPTFRPALTVQGMLASAWSERAADAEDPAPPALQFAPPNELLEEAVLRLGPHTEHLQHAGLVPANLLQLAPAIHRVLAADLSLSRLYLLSKQGDHWEVVRDFYLSSGAHGSRKQIPGDQRTPIGIYSLSSRLPASRLPALAGHAAWPLVFPNRWDQWQGHLGSGIWIHGAAPGQYDGLPHSTNGCLALSDTDLDVLAPVLADPGTVVLLAEQLEWIGPAQQAARRSAAFARLMASGMDSDRLHGISVYAYPGEGSMLLVRSGEGSPQAHESFWPTGARQPLFADHS